VGRSRGRRARTTSPASVAATGLLLAPVAAVALLTGSSLVELLHRTGTVLGYVGILGTSGLVLFRELLLDRAASSVRGHALRPTALLAGVALLGLLLHLAADGAWRTGAGPAGLVDPEVLWDTVVGTPVGPAAGVAVVGLLLALGRGHTVAGRVLVCGGAVLALLCLPLTGHTRSVGPAWLVVGSDTLHVLAGALWFGGLLGLVLTLRRSVPADAAARTVVRFSTTAAGLVAAVAVTGTLLAWRILPDAGALVRTGYGRTLVAKVAVVALVVAIAAWNRFRLVPRAADTAAHRTLRRTVAAEAALVLLALAVTGVLVSQSPM